MKVTVSASEPGLAGTGNELTGRDSHLRRDPVGGGPPESGDERLATMSSNKAPLTSMTAPPQVAAYPAIRGAPAGGPDLMPAGVER